MGTRLLAALPLAVLALPGCETAETARNVGGAVAADKEPPPVEDLCGDHGAHCLSWYYWFSSEASGAGWLAGRYKSLEEDERRLRERAAEARKVQFDEDHRELVARYGFELYWQAVEYEEEAEGRRRKAEALREFVAGWLAAYSSEKEAYLAVAAAALDRAWGMYCRDVPLRALEAERVGETWYEVADRLGTEAANRAAQAGELLPETDYLREALAHRIEGGERPWGKPGLYEEPALVAPGYENAGETLLSAMSCEGGGR